mmetsp:Transcript_33392/g.78105  ORF Transcript_33392/g.78105 Transcript_33392/m.78105 type:complete len:239 (-) Transcript_33392:222-938(-)
MARRPAYSPEAPELGCSDMPGKPVISQSIASSDEMSSAYPVVWSAGAKGWMPLTSFHVTGIISAVELSFIVHEPSGIMQCTSEMSLLASLKMYLSIWCSDWCEQKTGCAMNSDVRTSGAGTALSAAVVARSSSAEKGGAAPLPKALQTASRSARDVVSSHASVSWLSDSLRKLRPSATPAAITSSTLIPPGGETQTVSKKGSAGELQPSLSRPAWSRVAACWQCEAMALRPAGPWYMP